MNCSARSAWPRSRGGEALRATQVMLPVPACLLTGERKLESNVLVEH